MKEEEFLKKSEEISSSVEKAKEYLESEGYDVKEIVNEGMKRIAALKERISINDLE